jgi:hypothetical protein
MRGKTNHSRWLLCTLFLLVAACTAAAGEVIYVDAGASIANNGSSWADAYWCLQDALANARSGDEIRVAQGSYKPDQYYVATPRLGPRVISSGDRTAAFQLINGVTIKGGYTGPGEPNPDARDITLYRTILSGDLDGDDGLYFTNNSENSYHVVTGSGINSTAVLDGFTVTGGNADGASFPNNNGGGMYNDSGSPTIINCTFSRNSAGHGDGMRGGGIHNTNYSSPTLINCTFTGNLARWGGGMHNMGYSHPKLTNCTFSGNSAEDGGAMANGKRSDPMVTNCTFTGNRATEGTGGISCKDSSPTVVNTILWGDSPNEIDLWGSSITVTYSDVQGGWPGAGNINANPLFVDAYGADDVIGTKDDNLRLLPESPCIDAGDNSAIPFVVDLDGNPRIVNGKMDMGAYESGIAPPVNVHYVVDVINGDDNNDGLSRETAFSTIQKGIDTAEDGGVVVVYPGIYQEEINFLGKALTVQGVFQGPAGVPVLQNPGYFAVSFYHGEGRDSILKNFIIKNSFIAVFIARSSPTISNVTVVENRYGIDAYAGSEPDISNSIFWNNAGSDLFGCLARYSCIEQVAVGEGNIDDDPLFVDPVVGDYRLASERGRYWPLHDVWVLDKVTSPCVDGGDPSADPFREPMPNGGRINMGAYGGTPQASLSLRCEPYLLPGQASNPSPADGAIDVELDVMLSWIASSNAVSHDVYFGTEDSLVFVGNQTATQFNPGLLSRYTTYFWRVDEVNSEGKTTGELWTFRTISPPKGRTCFTGETGVWVNGALVQISNAVTGQMVGKTYCDQAVPCLDKIEKVQEHEGTFVCYDVLLESGNCISVAECHYFLTESGRWISLQNLKTGTRLQTSKGSTGIISVTRRLMPYVGKVYNLKVEGSDRYQVGEDAVIVRDY